MSGLVGRFRQNGKRLCLALSQGKGVTCESYGTCEEEWTVLSKLYGKEWFFVVSRFPEHKRVGGFLNHCCFLGTQDSGKVGHCQYANSILSCRLPIYFLPSPPWKNQFCLHLQFAIFTVYTLMILDVSFEPFITSA